ncbi:MAG: CopG family transcriptional regulator [Parvularculaceae bacterium]
MQKVQTFLREDQKAALKRIAARTGKRQSDLIRQGVDLVIDRAENEKADWRAATDAVFGIWKDRTDLEEYSREFREAVKRRFPSIYGAR